MSEPLGAPEIASDLECGAAALPGRTAILAVAAVGVLHVMAIGLAGAESGECVVAFIAWMLAVLTLRGAGAGSGQRRSWVGGSLLLLVALTQSARMADGDLWFLKLLPFLLAGGTILALHGTAGILRNWRLWLVLVLVVAPDSFLAPILDPGGQVTAIHAPLAGFILHYLGFEVRLNGSLLSLPDGSIRVVEACSGFGLMALLFKVAIVAGVMLPMRRRAWLAMCLAALGIGLATGVIRVAILAALVGHPAWFYWLHGPAGRNLFPMLAFLCLAPFLRPAEGPVAAKIRRLCAKWSHGNRATDWSLPAMTPLALVFGCGVACLLPHRPDSLPRPVGEIPLAGIPTCPCQATVPPELQATRFDRVDGAWLWTADDADYRWTILICSVSGAQEGPFEMLCSPAFRDFVRAQAAPSLSATRAPLTFDRANSASRLGTIPIQGGRLGFFAVNGNGRFFLETNGYLKAKTAALKSWRSWVQWLVTGRRLEDRRYWLGVIVATRPATNGVRNSR